MMKRVSIKALYREYPAIYERYIKYYFSKWCCEGLRDNILKMASKQRTESVIS